MLVVVLLLLSSRVVVAATAATATAEPPARSGRRHRHDHLHRRCRRNRIRCSYHRRPHLAAAFTAVVDAVIVPPPHRGRTFPQRSYRWLSPFPRPPPSSLPSPLHSLQPSLLPSLSPSPQPPKQPNFLARCKKYRGNSRSQTPPSYPSQNKTAQIDVTLIHSENTSEKKRCKF